jgi:predicted ATPase/signal transduction histidine kinase/tRNA A-37 threonylcarbamoyl transferase component Bud32
MDLAGYTFTNKIYESTNSLVYRGWRKTDSQPVILKILKIDYPSLTSLIRYKQEYEITHNLNLKGVIKVYSLEKYQNSLVMVLEDFGGESLKALLKEEKFELEFFLKMAIQITSILGEIHAANVIHKDLNPSNIVLNFKTQQIKLIDFGIATVLSRENPTIKNPNVLEGTLNYMSPEQTGRMNRSMDYRTDFYSLGVTFYELLTHQLPFQTTDAMELVHCHLAKHPIPPHEINPNIPPVLSELIIKLLEKTAEERYQSAWGIKADLEECLQQLQTNGEISSFILGRQDISEKFQIPQKLYGRDREVETLLNAFERVSAGSSEIMLVSGYSGIGKSALVQEIYKPITRQKGYFIAGKFDQFQRNIPYSAIVSGFQSLVRQLLTESETQLQQWQEKLLAALGSNGQIIIDVVPEVELIIGKQPPVQELGPTESQNRFNLVFQNFIRVFCHPSHPLVIFLDDLQWADSATLNLIEIMMTDENIGHLFLIGAYRDNEVNPTHPLLISLENIAEKGATIHQIILLPLALEDINHLIAETLHRDPESVQPLARLVMQKTEGNPFFMNQFLKTLYQENLLTFERPQSTPESTHSGQWNWDIQHIESLCITENVVELMIAKLKKLPEFTQHLLQLAACVGNCFDLYTLAIISETPAVEVFQGLLPAIQEGLILPTSDLETTDQEVINSHLVILTYAFLHDRVQQSAYALIEQKLQREVHLQIGRLLLANLSEDQRGERIFELVDHLNIGWELLTEGPEKTELAHLNLFAARKAKDSLAYAAARGYLATIVENTTQKLWQTDYSFAFTLHKELAELEYLNGNFEASEALIEKAVSQAHSALEKAEVYNMLIVQYTLLMKYEEAIGAGLTALKWLGLNLPETDWNFAVEVELAQARKTLENREVSSLIHEAKMTNPIQTMAMKVLGNMGPLTFFSHQDIWKWTVIKAINLSLEYGFVAGGSYCYSCYGIILSSILGEYQAGYEFGKLSLALSENFGNWSQNCQDNVIFSNYLNCWIHHVKSTNYLNNKGFQVGVESGNLQWSGYNRMFQALALFYQGINLERTLEEYTNFLWFCHKTKNQWSSDIILANQLAIFSLMGKNDESLEIEYFESFHQHKSMAALCEYHVLKAQVLYLYHDYEEALKWALSARELIDFILGHISSSHHTFYYSLILTALYPTVSKKVQKQYWQRLLANQKQMKIWAENCPENFEHKYLLVAAEMAQILGQKQEAMELYDQAIAAAKEQEFIQNEALANELAAQFWFSLGKDDFAHLYLKKAHYNYQLWGALGKVEQLERKYPQLSIKSQEVISVKNSLSTQAKLKVTTSSSSSSSSNPGVILDLVTVIKASQAISGEIFLEELLNKLMTMMIENAGAQKGFLILNQDEKMLIEAAKIDEKMQVGQSVPVEESQELALSVINYVARTQKSLLLNDAANHPTFSTDLYIQSKAPKSILGSPIINQGKMVGILYLENNLTTGAFTSERIEILRILCAQAATALVNASLYEKLEEYSRNLEVKVEERTQELKEKNEQLELTLQQLTAAQKQIISQEKLASLGMLTAGIAHEIRNPLNFINNFASVSVNLAKELEEELENQGENLEAESVEYIKEILTDLRDNMIEINQQGQKAQSIIQGMLMHARSDSGKRQKSDINAILAEAIKLVYHGKRAKDFNFNISIETSYDSSIEPIEVFVQDISRAFINIINNACYAAFAKKKEMPAEFAPTLSVKTLDQAENIQIKIRDNGPGIPEDLREKIFHPFFTTKPTGEGTGLGLSMTHDIIVGQHQGQIEIQSEKGHFAEFTILLPKKNEAA